MSVDVWSGSPKTAWVGLLITVECHVNNSIQYCNISRENGKQQMAELVSGGGEVLPEKLGRGV